MSPHPTPNSASPSTNLQITPPQKDHWTPSAYTASAPFVPLLTHEITTWLSPSPTSTILDLGCGDGLLTAQLASRSSHITAFDASDNLIAAARSKYGDVSNIDWYVVDCRYLESCSEVKEGVYDKVFSNAALHWILRDEGTKKSVLRGVWKALREGGEFVFEMGGKGNCADVHTALLAALVHQGVSIKRARESCPWFFPSEELMRGMLEELGFRVQKSKVEYRPTRLTGGKDGGLEGWVRLMGAQFLEVLETKAQKEAVVREVCEVLESVLTREEDGSVWLGYVRLKMVAIK